MTTPTINGAIKLMESSNEIIIMKIKQFSVKKDIIILITEDSESNHVQMWSQDAANITMQCYIKPGVHIKVIEWQQNRNLCLVMLNKAEIILKNQQTGTQQLHANQRRMQTINSFRAVNNVVILPIKALKANCSSWRIKAKVLSKSPMKVCLHGRNKYFYLILADKDGDKIDCFFWSKVVEWSEVVNNHKYFNLLEEGNVYEFSGGRIDPVIPRWAKTNHSYTIHFNQNENIKIVQEQIETKLNLKTIDDLNDQSGIVDMLVKVLSHSPKTEIKTKHGPKLIKKVQVADISQKSIEIILWNEFAEMLEDKSSDLDNKCVIALICAKYKIDNQGQSSLDAYGLLINPTDIPKLITKINKLKDQVVDLNNIKPTSDHMKTAELLPIKMYEDLVQDPEHLPEKTNNADIQKYTIVGLHNYAKRPENSSSRYPWYQACPNSCCNKKIDEKADKCHQCNTDMQFGGNYKFKQLLALCGPTKQVQTSAFEREYRPIININGNEYKRLQDENQDDLNAMIFQSLYRPYAMTIKIQKDEQNGETNPKVNILGSPTRLFECEGGDAVESFKLMVELNKKADSKIGLQD